jgi:hypothetical protein
MYRANPLVVWENTCRPLVTAGDNKQLAPVVMHQDITDMFGNYLNRLVDEAQL